MQINKNKCEVKTREYFNINLHKPLPWKCLCTCWLLAATEGAEPHPWDGEQGTGDRHCSAPASTSEGLGSPMGDSDSCRWAQRLFGYPTSHPLHEHKVHSCLGVTGMMWMLYVPRQGKSIEIDWKNKCSSKISVAHLGRDVPQAGKVEKAEMLWSIFTLYSSASFLLKLWPSTPSHRAHLSQAAHSLPWACCWWCQPDASVCYHLQATAGETEVQQCCLHLL